MLYNNNKSAVCIRHTANMQQVVGLWQKCVSNQKPTTNVQHPNTSECSTACCTTCCPYNKFTTIRSSGVWVYSHKQNIMSSSRRRFALVTVCLSVSVCCVTTYTLLWIIAASAQNERSSVYRHGLAGWLGFVPLRGSDSRFRGVVVAYLLRPDTDLARESSRGNRSFLHNRISAPAQ